MLGTGQNLTAYNCYVIPIGPDDPNVGRDSRRAIIDTLRNMVEIMSRGGGVGINLSTLRPRLAYVKGVNGKQLGCGQLGRLLFSFATGLVEQGGIRPRRAHAHPQRLAPGHPRFHQRQARHGAITNANISVGITDDFSRRWTRTRSGSWSSRTRADPRL